MKTDNEMELKFAGITVYAYQQRRGVFSQVVKVSEGNYVFNNSTSPSIMRALLEGIEIAKRYRKEKRKDILSKLIL